MLYAKTLEAISLHALAEYPREACGLIIAVGRKEVYRPCRNLAEGKDQFRLAAEDWADAEDAGKILAIVHSHPDADATPSEADRVSCEASGLPWVIASVRDGKIAGVHRMAPSGHQAPLLGRQFFHGVLDCYTLVKDFYHRELGVDLIDGDRDDDWWKKGQDLYMDRYGSAGFRKLGPTEEVRYGDVILMAVHSPVANHAAVYLGTERLKEAPHSFRLPNAMIHHLYGRLSERAVYGGYWAETTRVILRHTCYEQSVSTGS